MNKRKIEKMIPNAIEAIKKCGISSEGEVSHVYRAYISSFGAAVIMGSLKASVAFLSADTDSTKGNRGLLLRAMYYVLHEGNFENEHIPTAKEITNQVLAITDKAQLNALKEDYLTASVAIKVALNAFDLIKE